MPAHIYKSRSKARLSRPAVVVVHGQLVEIESSMQRMLMAAVVMPLRIHAFAERQHAADLAEAMLDHVFVERVGGQFRLAA